MTFIVALTGGIGSGKSAISAEFEALGVPVVDADIIARKVVEKNSQGLAAIAAHFGKNILNDDGTLNRKALREIIFHNESERLWLNALLHPLIEKETEKQFQQHQNAPYLLWVVPLLIENNLQNKADRVLIIDVSPEIQLDRVIKRDNIDKILAEKMLSSQMLNKERLVYAHDIITNNDHRELLKTKVESLHKKYLTLASMRS